MKAIIPAAGMGSRLRPHTHTAPKTLLHVAGKPILGHIIDALLAYDIREVVVIVGFLGDMIIDYISKNYNIKASFIEQKEPKGLGWAIYLAREHFVGDPVMITLGDTIFDLDISDLLKAKYDTIGTKIVDDPRRFGIVETNGEYVTRLIEKPEVPISNQALVGLYYIKSTELFGRCLEELVAKNITTRGEFQLTDALGLMLKHNCKITTFNVNGWFDCGKKDTLLATNRYLLSQIKTVDEYDDVIVIPPVYISSTAKVRNSVIGPYVSVADGAVIENSIIKDSIISSHAEVRQCLLETSLVGNNSSVIGVYKQLNLGDSSEIGYY
ncbi:MAG: nucleotidyl transferase [candidate division Zixibacteria bacterium 4484_95]|nr:MAG: nucleotidyl transferase [candidate division Zixibacteria bacterium 4484_95]